MLLPLSVNFGLYFLGNSGVDGAEQLLVDGYHSGAVLLHYSFVKNKYYRYFDMLYIIEV